MPKTKMKALNPPAITRPQGKLSLRMGPPPVPGKPVTTGRSVVVSVIVGIAVAGFFVSVIVGIVVAGVFVSVKVGGVIVPVLVVVGVCVMVRVVVVVDVFVDWTAQNKGVMLLVSSVTAPFRARALPVRLAFVVMVILADARILPTN